MDGRYLQIDHRVPYEIAGEGFHEEVNVEEYMLLDASSQELLSNLVYGWLFMRRLCGPR